ncbi:Neuronal pentraxin-2 [Harpegnathos saltator]|uniref:Neuronal pentraxin-2 n=1 Tax=Harpegnathos saltator TaxID=610380 RepID=E2B5G8_HARSA|nr:Neuronal pentraxin-2 [Harpegnathos saltator]
MTSVFTIACAVLVAASRDALAISSSWRPIVPAHSSASILHQEASIFGNAPTQTLYDVDSPHHHLLLPQAEESCSLYKVAMSQQLYFEYIHYKTDLPDMKEFTLCMWTKFYNHSNDHPLFSYAVGDQPRGILSWVANTPRSSYYMLNVNGHNLYRLNYPLRLNKWYHSCQSWNGRTGEWQIWVNDERVGRGFNNRLVGHAIKGGGIAISGQEQRQLGGGFLEGEGAPPGSGGYLGELTMLQLYNVALTAGKAHKDHKHHHAHHYEHDTSNNTPRTTTRAPVTGPPLPPHPFLTGGQINTQGCVKINPGAAIQLVRNGVTIRHPALPPISPESPPPQPLPPLNLDVLSTAFPNVPTRFFGNPSSLFPGGTYHNLFKREKNESSKRRTFKDETVVSSLIKSERPVAKRDTEKSSPNPAAAAAADDSDGKVSFVPKSETADEKKLDKRESDKKKRGLLQLGDGSIYDDGYSIPQGLDNDYFTGLTSFGLHLKETSEEDEREPAEAEVKQVMDMCDGCADEPFEKALIVAWRSVPKKLYSGALFLPAVPACKEF